MRARVIQTLPELLTLREHWERLLAASADSTPWQDIDFLGNWWRHMGDEHRLRVVVVERDGIPCLIMPLQISKWPWLRLLPVYILEPIGSIMDVNRPRLALGEPDDAAYECALEAVWGLRREWHTIRIDEKLWDDMEVAQLRRFAIRHDLLFQQRFSHLCPHLDLRQDWETFLSGRSSKMRKNLRAAQRKLQERGPVTLQVCRSPSEIAMGFGTVLKLHQRSWKRQKKVEHSHSDAYRSFYAGWLQAMARRDSARILILRCADQPAAATVAFTDAHCYYSAQIVHDAEYGACSPGTLLEAMELEGLMREKRFSRYDMLGSFLNNKLRWTDTTLSTTHVFVMQRSLRTLILDTYYFKLKPVIRPRLLPLLNKLRPKRKDP